MPAKTDARTKKTKNIDADCLTALRAQAFIANGNRLFFFYDREKPVAGLPVGMDSAGRNQ